MPIHDYTSPARLGLVSGVALLTSATLLTGCTEAPVRPSPRVVEETIVRQREPLARPEVVWQPGSDRLYRMGDTWVARREGRGAALRLSPSAQRLLLTSAEGTDPYRHPAPLSQELAEELSRLRTLTAQNREAMERLNGATASLLQAAQELAKRNETVPETQARPKPTPTPLANRTEKSARELLP